MVELAHIFHLNAMLKCGQLKKLWMSRKRAKADKLPRVKFQLEKNDQIMLFNQYQSNLMEAIIALNNLKSSYKLLMGSQFNKQLQEDSTQFDFILNNQHALNEIDLNNLGELPAPVR